VDFWWDCRKAVPPSTAGARVDTPVGVATAGRAAAPAAGVEVEVSLLAVVAVLAKAATSISTAVAFGSPSAGVVAAAERRVVAPQSWQRRWARPSERCNASRTLDDEDEDTRSPSQP